jgi:hypothetical protein
VQGEHVHVALDHHHLAALADGGARAVEAVQQLALLEERGLGGVEVLRHAVVEQPTGEADDAAERVADREHHPATEPVVAPAALVLGDQPGLEQVVVAHAAREHVLQQAVPAVGGEAQPPVAHRLVRQPATPQVVGRGLPGSWATNHASATSLISSRSRRRPLAGRRAAHLDADALAQELQGVAELDALRAHDVVEHVALGAAAEAVEEAALDVDVERRRALAVERAEPLELPAAGGLERDRLADDLGEVDARPDALLGVVELAHGPARQLTRRPRPGRAAGDRSRPRRRARRPR